MGPENWSDLLSSSVRTCPPLPNLIAKPAFAQSQRMTAKITKQSKYRIYRAYMQHITLTSPRCSICGNSESIKLVSVSVDAFIESENRYLNAKRNSEKQGHPSGRIVPCQPNLFDRISSIDLIYSISTFPGLDRVHFVRRELCCSATCLVHVVLFTASPGETFYLSRPYFKPQGTTTTKRISLVRSILEPHDCRI